MNDIRLHFANDDLPQDSETREARHELLASFLAAYADSELPAETHSQIEAHLAGCGRCRRELDMHRAVRERLGREPVPAATAALRDRIATGIRLTPLPATAAPDTRVKTAGQSVAHAPVRTFTTAVLVVLMASAFVYALYAGWERKVQTQSEPVALATATQAVPLFAAVLSDYRRVTAGDLPGRARDLVAVRAAVPFPVAPLSNPKLRLLAAWTTSLADEPAAVLAYRWHDRVVLQYLVSEGLLFQSPNVRASLARAGAVVAEDGAQGLLLWAEPESGSLLIGDLSPSEFTALRPGHEKR